MRSRQRMLQADGGLLPPALPQALGRGKRVEERPLLSPPPAQTHPKDKGGSLGPHRQTWDRDMGSACSAVTSCGQHAWHTASRDVWDGWVKLRSNCIHRGGRRGQPQPPHTELCAQPHPYPQLPHSAFNLPSTSSYKEPQGRNIHHLSRNSQVTQHCAGAQRGQPARHPGQQQKGQGDAPSLRAGHLKT